MLRRYKIKIFIEKIKNKLNKKQTDTLKLVRTNQEVYNFSSIDLNFEDKKIKLKQDLNKNNLK